MVPGYFYDARKFEKTAKNKKSKGKSQANTFMRNFTEPKGKDFITAVKNTHKQKPISVNDLNKKLKSANTNLNKKFMVEGHIVGIVDSKPENVIKILESGKVLDLNSKLKKGGNYKYIFNIVMLLSDNSMKKNKSVNVYLTTNEGEQNVFTNWNLLPE